MKIYIYSFINKLKKHNKTVRYVENINQGKTNKKDLLENLYGYPLRK